MNKTLGQRIRELRQQKDMSLREFAKKIDVSAAFLSDVELSRRNPTDEHLMTIAKALDVALEDLKAHDTRAPIAELRQLAISDPKYGFALRKVVDEELTPEELMAALEQVTKRRKK